MKFLKTNFLIKSLFVGLFLRFFYLFFKTGEVSKINLGGDPCHHFNIAYNISKFNGAKTDFIFSFWHRHDMLPALTDIYPPGFHIFSAFFIFLYDDFLVARFISIIIFLLNIFFTLLIANKINRKDIGVVASFIILFNYFHIENSVVFMTTTFSMLVIQIFFYFLITFDKTKKYIYFLGLSVGYSSITFGGWQILILIVLYYFLVNKHKVIKNYFLFFLGFLTIYLPWGIITFNYFNIPFYSNLNFYPIISRWEIMLHSTTKPTLQTFLNEVNIITYIVNHLYWMVNNLIRFSLTLFPTFLFPLSFLLIPMIIHGAIKLKKYGIFLILFIFLYFIALSLSSYAFNGNLFTRHFIPFLFAVSILMSNSIIEISKLKIFNNFVSLIDKYKNIFLFFSFLITLSGIFYKDSFWNTNTKPFYEFGEKIKSVVPQDSKIMYGSTPQDLWCVSKRQVILDPNNMSNFRNDRRKNRVREEIEFYRPEFILIDFSNHIYDRSNNNLVDTLKNYSDYNLTLKLSDEINGYYLYKVSY